MGGVGQVPGEAEGALHRLQAKLLDTPSGAQRPSAQVQAALEAVRTIIGHLRAWGLPGAQVALDPLLRPHCDYYSGVVFQARACRLWVMCHLGLPASKGPTV
jgi:histidyl-tRNA synthetase